MTLSKLEWRAVKEALLTQYQAHPDEVIYPPCIVREQLRISEDVWLHEAVYAYLAPQLPWPFDKMHLLAVDSHTADETRRDGKCDVIGEGPSSMATLFSLSRDRLFRGHTTTVYQVQSIVGQGGGHYARSRKLYLNSVPTVNDFRQRLAETHDLDGVSPGIAKLVVDQIDGKDGTTHLLQSFVDGAFQTNEEATWEFQRALFSTYVIAGYHKVEAQLPEGFGPKKIRRLTAHKSFFVFFESNPTYTVSDLSGKSSATLKTGHERRAHFRHDWLGAGIDRTKLPKDPIGRTRIARDYHVRVVRVRQTWVGPKTFVVGGVTYTKVDD